MPRVGSKQSITWTPRGDPARDRDLLLVAARQAADLVAGPGVDLERLDGAVDHLPFAREVDEAPLAEPGVQRQRDVLADRALHQQGVGAVGRHVDDARADGVAGMAERHGLAVDGEVAARSGARARRGCRTARPGPGPRARRRPSDLAGVELERDVLEPGPRLRPRAASRGFVSAARAAACARSPAPGRRSTTSPSISSTIRSSEPAVTSTTPTVAPSRRTVARSQTAAISIMRWEMKMTQRSPPRWRPTTSSTRSVRFAGRAAVISSSIRTSGSMASARARSMMRSVASGRRRASVHRTGSVHAQLVHPVAERLDRGVGRAAGSTGCRGRG